MAQPLPMNCPTAMVSVILERVRQWGLNVACAVSFLPKSLDLGSVVDDQAWARPPKPPTFGEFLSQHKAEVSSRRRRKNSRPQAKVAPRAYRWGAPPLGHSPPQHAWVCAVLSGFSLRVQCSVLALCLLPPLPSVQHARCSLKRSTSHPSPLCSVHSSDHDNRWETREEAVSSAPESSQSISLEETPTQVRQSRYEVGRVHGALWVTGPKHFLDLPVFPAGF